MRNDADHYPTPYPYAASALRTLPLLRTPQRILDTGAGLGVWGFACRLQWPNAHITGVELRDVAPTRSYDRYYHHDFLTSTLHHSHDLIVGNPPYSLAEQFVRKSHTCITSDGIILYLLRLGFLEAQKRIPLWQSYPPQHIHVFSQRPSFSGDGATDATAYALYRWQPAAFDGQTTLSWIFNV